MSYIPPKTIWEVEQKLSFNEPLESDDPRFVPTEHARGDFSFIKLLKPLGINPKNWQLMFDPERVYTIFCGHRGCGKSTELRRIAEKLHAGDRFFVVFLDAVLDLDTNNLQYSEILMAMAKRLLDKLQALSIKIDSVFLENLQSWFIEKIEQNCKAKSRKTSFFEYGC